MTIRRSIYIVMYLILAIAIFMAGWYWAYLQCQNQQLVRTGRGQYLMTQVAHQLVTDFMEGRKRDICGPAIMHLLGTDASSLDAYRTLGYPEYGESPDGIREIWAFSINDDEYFIVEHNQRVLSIIQRDLGMFEAARVTSWYITNEYAPHGKKYEWIK